MTGISEMKVSCFERYIAQSKERFLQQEMLYRVSVFVVGGGLVWLGWAGLAWLGLVWLLVVVVVCFFFCLYSFDFSKGIQSPSDGSKNSSIDTYL